MVPSKFDLLKQMMQQQQHNMALLLASDAAKNSGDLKAARAAYDKLIASLKQHLQTALLHNEHYENPVEITPIVQPLLNALFTQADVLQVQGNLWRPEQLRMEALELARKYLGDIGIADAQRSRAASLISEARFNEALVALAEARDSFERAGDIIKVARTTMDIVNILQWLGDHSRALAEIKRVSEIVAPLLSGQAPRQKDIFKSLVDNMELYRISIEIDYYQGLINRALGNFEDADQYFAKVLPAYQNLGSGPGIEYQLAADQIGLGKYREALAAFARLEPQFRKSGLVRPKLAALLKFQAEALLHLGKPNEALRKLEEGLKDLAVYYDPDLLWKLQWLQGQVSARVGKKEKALEAYVKAAATVNNLRKAPLGYRLDSTYLKDKLRLFQDAIVLGCEIRDAEACCELMEMVKSRILTSTLSISPEERSASTQQLEKEFDDITRKLDALEYRGYQGGWTDELEKNRESLLTERAALLERIRFSDPRWRSMTAPVPFDLGRVAKVLSDRGQAALSLFYLPDKVIAVLVKDKKSAVAQVEIAPDVNSKLENYIQNLQAVDFNPAWFDLSEGLGVEAQHLIPRELLSQAVYAKQLIVVPHGPLHLVAWAGVNFEGKRLFEYCPIGVLPNLSCITSLKHDFLTSPKVALIGAPDYSQLPNLDRLPFAEAEMSSIADSYLGAARLIGSPLVGRQATEKGFWRLANDDEAQGAILHMACHGSFEPEEPMHSGLLLTDSKVDAAEISRSSLKFDEIILSACSTGYRPLKVHDVELSGDDILGLPGALLESGVRSVLVSIPEAADDATFNFMVDYHDYRLEGKTPLAALQETQKAMLSNGLYPPHTWIGFTVYGCQ